MHWCGGESGCDSSMWFKESLYEFTVSLDLIHEGLLNIHRNKFFVFFFLSLSAQLTRYTARQRFLDIVVMIQKYSGGFSKCNMCMHQSTV